MSAAFGIKGRDKYFTLALLALISEFIADDGTHVRALHIVIGDWCERRNAIVLIKRSAHALRGSRFQHHQPKRGHGLPGAAGIK